MIIRGEILIGLSIEPSNNNYEIEQRVFEAKFSQLLNSMSEVETNIFYVVWLFGKIGIGGEKVMKGTILEHVQHNKESIRGFNW